MPLPLSVVAAMVCGYTGGALVLGSLGMRHNRIYAYPAWATPVELAYIAICFGPAFALASQLSDLILVPAAIPHLAVAWQFSRHVNRMVEAQHQGAGYSKRGA